MKKIKSMMLYSAMAVFALTSCSDDDGNNNGNNNNSGNVVKSGGITSDETWTADKIYQLSGRVVVESGATLTIEPGTIIKAEGGREANASALIIARGGKIMANGTASQPIIFTSVLDEIAVGETESPNLDETFNGLWGGLIVLGRATISADNSEVQIEGIPADDTRGLYGGSIDDDNSGVINYVSVRFGGTLIGEGNEINGITLGGVGNATTITNVEVVSNLDDGIEWFGGTVNVTNALVWGQGDDAFDVDQAYSGTIDNFMFIGSADSDHGLEIDGAEGSFESGFTMQNGTMIGWNDGGEGGGEYADFRDGARGTFTNIYWTNFSQNSDVELDAGDDNDDPRVSNNYANGDLEFINWEFNTSHLTSGNVDVSDIFSDKLAGVDVFALLGLGFASNVTAPGAAGADVTAFSWTSAKAQGAF